MSSLTNGFGINQNTDDISELAENLVNRGDDGYIYNQNRKVVTSSKSVSIELENDKNIRKSYYYNSGELCSKEELDEDFCMEQSSDLVDDSSILSSDSRTINKLHPNRSGHSIFQVVDEDNRYDQIRSYITLLLVNIFFILDFGNRRNDLISHIIIIVKEFGIVGLCFLSTNSIELSSENASSLENIHLNESSQDDFTSSSPLKIDETRKDKEYCVSKIFISVPTCIEKGFKFFFSRKAILFFVYGLSWLHFWSSVEDVILTRHNNTGTSTDIRKTIDDEQIVYFDPEVVDNSTVIVVRNATIDVIPFQVEEESHSLCLPNTTSRQPSNVPTEKALISTKQPESIETPNSLDPIKECTQSTVSQKTKDAVVTLSSERHMINFVSFKELLILREQCVKRKVQMNGHIQNDVFLMMELSQHGHGRQFDFKRTRERQKERQIQREKELISIESSFAKEEMRTGAIMNMPKSPIGFIASVSLRKQEKTLEIIRKITRNGSRARRQIVKAFHEQIYTWTETEIASTLYIVWTNPGILD